VLSVHPVPGTAANGTIVFLLALLLYCSYTIGMKTAISIPDNLFRDAEITAKQLGLARSQLYAKAIREFVEHHNKKHITEKLNSLYSRENNLEGMTDVGMESLREGTKNDSW
jgi:hypothetical protein